MRRIIAELLAFLISLLLAIFAAGIVAGAAANVFWPLFIAGGCLMYYLLRPWMRQVLNVHARANR